MQIRNLIHCLDKIVVKSIQSIAKKINKVDESVAGRRHLKIYEGNFQKESWNTKIDTNARNERLKQHFINKQQQAKNSISVQELEK